MAGIERASADPCLHLPANCRRTDFVTIDNDVVEVKTGKAKLSPGQAKLKADIDNGRPVTPVGKNAAKAGLKPGQATTMRFCGVYRC